MKRIEILGIGCKSCEKAEVEVRNAALSLGWSEGTEFTIEKVSDPGDIAARGVFITPGITVDGKVVSTGKVPPKKDIVKWLK
jgi:small redox-active disulfide protein 2